MKYAFWFIQSLLCRERLISKRNKRQASMILISSKARLYDRQLEKWRPETKKGSTHYFPIQFWGPKLNACIASRLSVWFSPIHLSGEFVEVESKFPAIKSYLPLPTLEHDAPLIIKGDSPKKDVSWSLVSEHGELIAGRVDVEIVRSFPIRCMRPEKSQTARSH